MNKYFYVFALAAALTVQPALAQSGDDDVITDSVASFDDIQLDANGYYNGADQMGGAYSGAYLFYNFYNATYGSWTGFSVSNRQETDFKNYAESQYNSCVGHGVNNSENYAVYFYSNYGIEKEIDTAPIQDRNGNKIKAKGFYVTNSAWNRHAYLNGDGMTPGAFATGDWCKLTVYGVTGEEIADSVEYYLADYRSGNPAAHRFVNDWEWIDISALGEVDQLNFKITSSRKNDYGMTTPAYFCMDDFAGEAPKAGNGLGVVDFEGAAPLNSDGYYNGSDEEGGFSSHGFHFATNYFSDYNYWSGTGLSNRTDTGFESYLLGQWNSTMGHGYKNSSTYAVVYPQGESIEVEAAPATISGFYVGLNSYVRNAIEAGDGMTPGAFTTGDWYKLSIIGLDEKGGKKDTIDYYLADYRSASEADHYYIKDWSWIDLTKLGEVKGITFRLSSSRNNDYGMTTPGYFLMDNFNGTYDGESDRLATGIEAVEAVTEVNKPRNLTTGIYSLDGRKLNKMQRGINIVRMADGTTRKILQR